MKPITEFQISNHGVEHAQYFQGAGVSFSRWLACYTGCGDSPAEALDNAIEMMAQADKYDPDSLPDGWDKEFKTLASDEETVTQAIEAQCTCQECKNNAEEEGSINCTHECTCFKNSELHCYVTIYVR